MKFDAIFIDLDGTLLTDRLTIAPGSIEILKRFSDSGILISIVTARSPAASAHFYEQLGIVNNPIICFNGAFIQKNGKTIYEITIENQVALEVISSLKQFEINTSVYRHYDWFAESADYWIRQEMEITQSAFTLTNFNDLFKQDMRANKLLGIGNPDKIYSAEAYLKNLGISSLTFYKSKPTYLEIMNNLASKKNGIEKVLELYHIDPEKIITIGDNYNDIDMLKFSKSSIAMGNAPDEVKKIATFVTDTNNNEGIKKALDFMMKS